MSLFGFCLQTFIALSRTSSIRSLRKTVGTSLDASDCCSLSMKVSMPLHDESKVFMGGYMIVNICSDLSKRHISVK